MCCLKTQLRRNDLFHLRCLCILVDLSERFSSFFLCACKFISYYMKKHSHQITYKLQAVQLVRFLSVLKSSFISHQRLWPESECKSIGLMRPNNIEVCFIFAHIIRDLLRDIFTVFFLTINYIYQQGLWSGGFEVYWTTPGPARPEVIEPVRLPGKGK